MDVGHTFSRLREGNVYDQILAGRGYQPLVVAKGYGANGPLQAADHAQAGQLVGIPQRDLGVCRASGKVFTWKIY